MQQRIDRRMLYGLVAVAVLALPLALVARSLAGSLSATYSTFAAPTQVTGSASDYGTNPNHPANKAVAGGNFTPAGPNNGTATHVVMTLDLPSDVPGPTTDDPSPIVVTTCPGHSHINIGTKVVTCTIAKVKNGTTATLVVEFTVPPVQAQESWQLNGSAAFDVGRGATGEHNILPPSPVGSLTFYPPKSNAAGTCAPITSSTNSLSVDDKPTQKGAIVSFGAGDPSTGLPCTPAQVAIDPAPVPGAQTPGSWRLDVAPLQNGALGSAALTIDDVPKAVDPATMPLYEVLSDGSLVQILPCVDGAMPNATAHVCLTGQQAADEDGDADGVEFDVNFVATDFDPRITS
jgi:hypothetical protein